MHYSERKSRRVVDRFRRESEGWNRKMQPFIMALVLAFVLFVIIDEPVNPWTPRLVGLFMLGMCFKVFQYVRPDLHFDLYRRYWPIKLHPFVQAEGDLLYRQLRQLAFSMGESRIEEQPGPRSSLQPRG